MKRPCVARILTRVAAMCMTRQGRGNSGAQKAPPGLAGDKPEGASKMPELAFCRTLLSHSFASVPEAVLLI